MFLFYKNVSNIWKNCKQHMLIKNMHILTNLNKIFRIPNSIIFPLKTVKRLVPKGSKFRDHIVNFKIV